MRLKNDDRTRGARGGVSEEQAVPCTHRPQVNQKKMPEALKRSAAWDCVDVGVQAC